ncbi:hypothetical protein C2845_PM05G16700 [Panicum miliaceum]|uniref:Uncharacterized protein n=1 Tax=Panicum miliaceum TaxID=4540 RepID=A0A3L6SY85_PANMI|nr:hypothetical protein C2845_PM05G16700 [Panicum miliaceum]
MKSLQLGSTQVSPSCRSTDSSLHRIKQQLLLINLPTILSPKNQSSTTSSYTPCFSFSFSIQKNSSTSTSYSPYSESLPSRPHQPLIHGSPPSQSRARLLFLQTSNMRQPIVLPDLVSLGCHGSSEQQWKIEPRRSGWASWTEAGGWWERAEEPSAMAYTTAT